MVSKYKKNNYGFTMVELLVALMVSGVIFGAIATLTFAVTNAAEVNDEASFTQAQVRYTTVRLTELLKNAKLITQAGSFYDLAVWKDDTNGDNQINTDELVFVEIGSARDSISLLEFGASSWPMPLSNIQDGSAKMGLNLAAVTKTTTEIIPQCSKAMFYPVDVDEDSEVVSILFEMTENGQARSYQISAALRCHAENLLTDWGLTSDDDD